MFVPPPPPLLTPHFSFPLELYVYITLTNNNLAFLIYQLIILWTITIKWHRWLLVNNHISNYNLFILVLYRRYINHVSVCPPLFGTLLRHCLYTANVYSLLCIIRRLRKLYGIFLGRCIGPYSFWYKICIWAELNINFWDVNLSWCRFKRIRPFLASEHKN